MKERTRYFINNYGGRAILYLLSNNLVDFREYIKEIAINKEKLFGKGEKDGDHTRVNLMVLATLYKF